MRRQGRRLLWACGVLVLVNAVVAWPLFFVEYLDYPGSIEGLFVALVRYYRDHWNEQLWYPFWNAGIPFGATYQPLLHVLGAVTAGVAGVSPAQAFHVAVAGLYVLGPVTLFLLLHRLLGSLPYSLAGGLVYSLISPSHFLVTAIREDTGGLWAARRLYTALAWGDSPHVSSLTFVPLALLGIDLFVREKRWRYWAVGAVGVALVFLTNIPGTLVLAMGTVAYGAARPLRSWLESAGRIALTAALGYALCAFFVPPSVLALVMENVAKMVPDDSGQGRVAGLLLAGVGLLLVRALLAGAGFALRFSACFFWIVAAVTLGSYWFEVSLIEQPRRFQLALEMAAASLAACGAMELAPRFRRFERPLAIGLSLFAAVQLWQYAAFSRRAVRPMEMQDRSEWKVAQWLDRHADGKRVYVPGSTAIWFNAFTDTPQLTGCCSQNRLMDAITIADYVIGTDDGAADRAVEISRTWLQVLGVDYVNVSGPGSTEHFHTIHNWRKFEGRFEEVWREGDDIIYRVPRASRSLAHAVMPDELVQRMPVNGIDINPLARYAAVMMDDTRPAMDFTWKNNHEAAIEGAIPQGAVVSVQVPYHQGWTAVQDGREVELYADALGLLVLKPRAAESTLLTLTFTGGRELGWTRGVSLGAALLALGVGLWDRKRSGAAPAGESPDEAAE